VFLGLFLCCSQKDNDSKRYLEKNWLQAKYESKKNLNILLYFWLPTWNHVEKSGNFFKQLVKILAIENLEKKRLISKISLLIF
jgi:hypothetical protein